MLAERKQLPHGVPSWVEDGSTYFITINCAQRHFNQLCHDKIAFGLKESLQFRLKKEEWLVYLCVLMHDHLHLLLSFSRKVYMRRSVENWKRFTARQIGLDWQRGYFDHRIRGVRSFQEKENYMRTNPVRKGFCQKPGDWKYLWTAMDLVPNS